MKPSYAALLLLAGALTTASPAVAQKHAQTRQGFWFNGGLGWGTLGCQNCSGRTGGVSGGLSLGGTIRPTILLGAGTTGWTKSQGGATLSVGTLDFRARFYPSATSGFFITAGVGAGSISAGFGGFGARENGGAGVVGLGYDFRIAPMLSITPFWNLFAVKTSNTDANVVQLGASITAH